MTKQPTAYPLRLNEELKQKLKIIAKENDRSFRGQVENILKNFIADYEEKHGEIDITEYEK